MGSTPWAELEEASHIAQQNVAQIQEQNHITQMHYINAQKTMQVEIKCLKKQSAQSTAKCQGKEMPGKTVFSGTNGCATELASSSYPICKHSYSAISTPIYDVGFYVWEFGSN